MENNKPVIIAEVCCNHRGNIDIAHKMIKLLGTFKTINPDSSIDTVKFQKRTPREILTEKEYNTPHPHPENSYGETYGRHREFLEFSIDQHSQLKKWCEEEDLIYSTSVFDLTSAKEIISINPKMIKIPSPLNFNFELLGYIRDNYEGEIHLSFGMTKSSEERKIVEFFKEKNRAKDLIIYACTSTYPTQFKDLCLYEITKLKELYGKDVKGIGFSGHHIGINADIAALALGARYFERHFTFDKHWKGTDHILSLEPNEIFNLAKNLRDISKTLTYKEKDILDSELPLRKKFKEK